MFDFIDDDLLELVEFGFAEVAFQIPGLASRSLF
jgi:hypothetical protein